MNNYIIQNMTKYNNYEHFSETFQNDYMAYFDKKISKPNFDDLYDIKYLMLIAEPGYGKTRLLKQLVLQGNENNNKVFFIDSKKIKSSVSESIKQCKIVENNISEEKLQKKAFLCNIEDYNLDNKTIVCLDALDELPFSKLYDFFEKVEEFISDYPNVKLFLSCRTHHLKKIEYDLSNILFEYITLDSFNGKQIVNYLESCNFNKGLIEKIEERSKLTNLFDFLSTPRYLYYFSELIDKKNIKEIINLSRSEMFEHFIYRKIDKERDKRYSESENHTLKRVLEELALIMKIYQVSQITKDDFFTVFKELNLSNIFTGQNLLEKLFDKSLLKDNIDYLEFENQEFLDFLASKELSRFEKVEQVFFDLAVEPNLKEVFASWFYVMPFVLEQHPFMINIMLEFLEQNFDKTLREDYFNVLLNIDNKFLDHKIKSRIFNLVFDYYKSHNQWLYSHASKLVHFYDENKHYKKIIDSTNGNLDENKVKIRNAIEIIEEISYHGLLTKPQLKFWKDKFSEYLELDVKRYKNLQSAIISSCDVIMRDNFEWIKNKYFIFESGIELQHEYSRTCNTIAPNDKFSIDIYFKTDTQFKKNQIDRAGRLDDNIKYICKVNTQEGLKYILKKLTYPNSKKYLSYILTQSYKDRYQDDLKQFVSNLENNINSDILSLIKKLVLNLVVEERGNDKYLSRLLLDVLTKEDKKYIYELIENIYQSYQDKVLLYFQYEDILSRELSKYFNSKNFDNIYKLFQKNESKKRTLKDFICFRLFPSKNLDQRVKEKIYETYKNDLVEYEKNTQKYKDKNERDARNRQLGLCKQWEHKIEPEPNLFVTDLFSFYLSSKESLQLCDKFEVNRNRTIEQAKKVIKFNNPLDGKVKVNGNSSTTWGIHYYKEVIELLEKENIELEEYLQDNVFRYLPFNINSEYETTLKLANNPSSKAVQDILDVYAGINRDDDLGIYHPRNFIEIYKRTKIKEAEPLLLKMLHNNDIEDYIRRQIIDILPRIVLSKEVIEQYISSNGTNDELYEDMLVALIKNFSDQEIIEQAFEIIIKKGKETNLLESESSLHGTTLDLSKGYNKLTYTLTQTDYDIEIDKELLQIAIELRDKDKSLNGYFFEEIVFNHIKYLNHKKSFTPIIEIEKFIQTNQSKTNLYSFEYRLKELKDIYLKELAKPKHIMEAIKSYKKSKKNEYIAVSSPLHLTEIIKESIEKDIKNWIEIEGAYKYIEELSKKDKNTNAEDFIQKTLKPQIELSLMKRGLRSTDITIKREEQTLDDKRADFTISYGFVGSVLLELKLESNPEAGNGKTGKEYKKKLKKYVGATNSDYGIFLIFNIKKTKINFEKQLIKLSKLYNDEENISVLGINCNTKIN